MATYIGGNPGTPRASLNNEINVSEFGGTPVTLGQKTKAQSIPVAFASDQDLTVVAEGDFNTASDHAEDDTHVTGATGSFILGVRNDNEAVRTTSDNDYSPLSVDSIGRLLSRDNLLREQFESAFSRILEKRFFDTEEVRYDIPDVLNNGFIYIGVATSGTLTSAASWTIVRFSFNATGRPSRSQIRTAVVWDNRAIGW